MGALGHWPRGDSPRTPDSAPELRVPPPNPGFRKLRLLHPGLYHVVLPDSKTGLWSPAGRFGKARDAAQRSGAESWDAGAAVPSPLPLAPSRPHTDAIASRP